MNFVATHYPALIVIIPLLMSVVVALLPSAGLSWLLTLAAVIASFATALFNLDQVRQALCLTIWVDGRRHGGLNLLPMAHQCWWRQWSQVCPLHQLFTPKH